jgi:L-phenylalanine/L-methionine N-acetyltransferase
MLMPDHVSTTPRSHSFSLRRREKRDAEALFGLFSQPQCRQSMVLEPFTSAEEAQAWFEGHGPDTFDFVATVNDTPIGFAGLYPCQGSQSHSGWLSLFVHDDFHQRGIGTRMLRALLATSDLLAGLSRIQLIVFCDNTRAISLYHKFGFKIEGRHECFARRGAEFVPAFTMARLTAKEPAKPLNMERMRDTLREQLALYQTA